VSEVAIFSGKGGNESKVVEHELGWFVHVGFNDVAEGRGVVG
jgi:hypothetical protein